MNNDKSRRKPPTHVETVFDRNTRNAKAIVDEDKTRRDEKTERLRQQRLEREMNNRNPDKTKH